MMKIETERLNIIALTPKQFYLWTHNIEELERQLLCSYRAEPMEGLFRKIVCGQVEKAQKKQDSVKHVIAETDVDGFSSQKILKRCGFKEYARNNTVWWRL